MLLVIVVFLLAALWVYSYARGQYWRRRGLPYEHSWPLLGSRAWSYFFQENLFQYAERMYLKHEGAIAVGLDSGSRRELLIRDPAFIRHIFITDFANYASRALNDFPADEVEPLRRNMLALEGEHWRWLRHVLAPAFTRTRLKAVFPLVRELAERLRARVSGLAPVPVDARELMSHYTVDFVCAYGFGLDANSINNKDNILYQLATKIFRKDILDSLVISLKEMLPRTCKRIKYLGRIEQDIFDLVNSIQVERDYKPSGRNDFMDLLLSIKQRQAKENRTDDVWIMDDKLLAAQAFLFFGAGFETSASATSYTLHMFAQHQQAQERARAEVLATLARHNGVITYEAVKEMTYLTWALKESMRLVPPVGNVNRKVLRSCYLPGVGQLDPGIRILVSACAFHRDPRYFPEPDDFRPERFNPDNLTPDAKLAYIPFGVGPRACIGK
ncbi:cytochrome P450 6a2-like [Choristoneura fumiferana]|uniref:cytochrome P450 6a2-like n=1 Tax=Choristoneura fumiferana TaxID=7141 RepID=UPI003D15D9A5